MKYVGLVTDRSWDEAYSGTSAPFLDNSYPGLFPLEDKLTINPEARRIFSDEVPMAHTIDLQQKRFRMGLNTSIPKMTESMCPLSEAEKALAELMY